MTMQLPDLLEREEHAAKIPALDLYGVFVGDIEGVGARALYPLTYQCNHDKATPSTALWRGYVATYRLFSDGRLVLETAHYPVTADVEPDVVNEEIVGDFWLQMREGFYGASVRVPFVNGRINDGESAIRT